MVLAIKSSEFNVSYWLSEVFSHNKHLKWQMSQSKIQVLIRLMVNYVTKVYKIKYAVKTVAILWNKYVWKQIVN